MIIYSQQVFIFKNLIKGSHQGNEDKYHWLRGTGISRAVQADEKIAKIFAR